MTTSAYDEFKARHAGKFAPTDRIFSHIRRGDRIFVGTGCGEPQHLVRALTEYVRANPKALFGAEILHVWSLGVAPYTDERLQANVRHNSFFVGTPTRAAVTAAKILASGLGISLHLIGVHRILAVLTGIYVFAAVLPWAGLLLSV